MTPRERLARKKARRKIVQAANRFAAARGPLRRAPWSARDVHRCAGICRRWCLVKPAVLIDAGFRPRWRA